MDLETRHQMKTTRHILYVSLIACFGMSIPFMFNTDFGAGCGYTVFFLVLVGLYATDRPIWERSSSVFKETDIDPDDIIEVTDDDEQYR